MRNFFGLECLVDDLTDIFKTINFCQYLFSLNILFDELDRGLRLEKTHS